MRVRRSSSTTAVVCAKLVLLVLNTSCCVSVDCLQAGGEEKCALSMLQLLPSSTRKLDTISTSPSYLTVISPPSGRLRSRLTRESALRVRIFGSRVHRDKGPYSCSHWRAWTDTFVKCHVSSTTTRRDQSRCPCLCAHSVGFVSGRHGW